MATVDGMGNAFSRIMNNNNRSGISLGNGRQNQDDRPKSQFWLNIGYPVDYDMGDGTTEVRFVSLPTGIPLDGQEKLPTNSKNEQFAAFQSARNLLLEQLMAIASQLKPGEEKTINLQVQLRRVNADAEPIKPENNPFAMVLNLVD
jgi:hypothetical protein